MSMLNRSNRSNLLFAASMALAVSFNICQSLFQSVNAQGPLRSAVRERIASRVNKKATYKYETDNIAGLRVAVWRPVNPLGPSPLVVFSHGFRGIAAQSESLMRALASAGYLVVAPNHRDAFGSGKYIGRPEAPFFRGGKWNDAAYKNRGEDIEKLIAVLKSEPKFVEAIDWTKVALIGHSLGGYTSLALAGAWSSWKLPEVKAVVALSPYTSPFLGKGNLHGMNVPVMYQCGTNDPGITPFLTSPNGAFNETNSPAYLVELQGANHFTWTNLNKQTSREKLIEHYTISFLDKYLKGDRQARPDYKLPGVAMLLSK